MIRSDYNFGHKCINRIFSQYDCDGECVVRVLFNLVWAKCLLRNDLMKSSPKSPTQPPSISPTNTRCKYVTASVITFLCYDIWLCHADAMWPMKCHKDLLWFFFFPCIVLFCFVQPQSEPTWLTFICVIWCRWVIGSYPVYNTESKFEMGFLPETQNYGLCMRREWRERLPRHRGSAIPTCMTARASRTRRYA